MGHEGKVLVIKPLAGSNYAKRSKEICEEFAAIAFHKDQITFEQAPVMGQEDGSSCRPALCYHTALYCGKGALQSTVITNHNAIQMRMWMLWVLITRCVTDDIMKPFRPLFDPVQ